tara:strand:- start:809 stop:1744 length:936 start_codon:yes stop_codon:yes gene_type:complete
MKTISIIGSGSWAHALSTVFVNREVLIKYRKSVNKSKFTGKKIKFTNRFQDLSKSYFIFLAIPSQTIRQNLLELKNRTSFYNPVFIICSKGVEQKTNKLMSEVVLDIFPKSEVVIFSGPNFSSELIANKPSASVLSSLNKKSLLEVSDLLLSERIRIYFNNDIIGTQLGGAMKNVIAIACGFVKGKNLGENAKAAIITRGISEIVKLGINMGAKRKTFYGLSGIGDLTLTCSSLKSRNTKFGYDLARGGKLDNLKANCVLEGLESCESICKLGQKYNVELPLCNSVKKLINGVNANTIISKLLSRPLQFEN